MLLTVSDVAKRLGVSHTRVCQYCRRGDLGKKIGSQWLITPDELETFVAARRGPGRPKSQLPKLPKVAGIYGVLCHETGKWYVGSSSDVHTRMQRHLRDCDKGYNQHIRDDSHKGYTFSAHILETVAGNSLMAEREAYWIIKKDAFRNGYNTMPPSAYVIEKLREVNSDQ